MWGVFGGVLGGRVGDMGVSQCLCRLGGGGGDKLVCVHLILTRSVLFLE